jgi:hypothetical protein
MIVGVTEIMVKKSKWREYCKTYLVNRCLYDCNRARFILACLHKGLSDYQIWKLGLDYDLVTKYDYVLENNDWYMIKLYPYTMKFVDALDSVFIPERMFDEADKYDYDCERFYRLFFEWESVIKNFERYSMLHESIHGAGYEEK